MKVTQVLFALVALVALTVVEAAHKGTVFSSGEFTSLESGVTDKGVATVTLGAFDKDGKTSAKFNVYVQQASVVNFTAAHLHYPADVGANGGKIVALNTPASGAFRTTTTVDISFEVASYIRAGKSYINLHSASEPNGRIRAHLVTDTFDHYAFLDKLETSPASTSSGDGVFLANHKTGVSKTYYANTATITSAHIHAPAALGVNGGVNATLCGSAAACASPIEYNLTAAERAGLDSQTGYINLHSSAFASGEIRGQYYAESQAAFPTAGTIQKTPVSVTGKFDSTNSANTTVTDTGIATVSIGTPALDGSATVKYNFFLQSTSFEAANITAAHFHGPAAAGADGDVIATVATPAGPLTSGEVTLTAIQIGYLLAGQVYVNIHSVGEAAGRVRAQLSVLGEGQVIAFLDAEAFHNHADEAHDEDEAKSAGTGIFISKATGEWQLYHANADGEVTSAHVHGPVSSGSTDGPAALVLCNSATECVSPITGTFTASELDLAVLTAPTTSKAYVNVHSDVNAAGDIRGDLKPLASGASVATPVFMLVAALVAVVSMAL